VFVNRKNLLAEEERWAFQVLVVTVGLLHAELKTMPALVYLWKIIGRVV